MGSEMCIRDSNLWSPTRPGYPFPKSMYRSNNTFRTIFVSLLDLDGSPVGHVALVQCLLRNSTLGFAEVLSSPASALLITDKVVKGASPRRDSRCYLRIHSKGHWHCSYLEIHSSEHASTPFDPVFFNDQTSTMHCRCQHGST